MRGQPPVGSRVGGYQLISLVGEGATGAVYLAEREGAPERVALKVLDADLAQDERFRRRLLRESTIAATLRHPHVVPILDFGESDDAVYLAMRHIDGCDLRELLSREGPLEPARAIDLLAQVADALDEARKNGLVHRDVKPANILGGRSRRGGTRVPRRLRARQARLLGEQPDWRPRLRWDARLRLPGADHASPGHQHDTPVHCGDRPLPVARFPPPSTVPATALSGHHAWVVKMAGVVLGYVYSPRVLAHDPPPAAVEVEGRGFTLGSVNVAQAALTAQAHDLVERSALGSVLTRIEPVPAPYEALLAVHTAEYLDRLRAASAGGPWDGEYAPVTPATWEAARLTVGGVLAAVDAVLDGRIQGALVHARPAGHHAEPDRAIASTYLNNLACGVEHAQARGVERVAIIDWDVHVANGAERIFWDRDEVLAISLHQQDWYPAHAGALRATGGSGAEGTTVNVPLPPATTDAGYRLAFDEIVEPIVRGFRPELIMVAAGQDASVFDPTGRMMVSAAGFRTLAERVAHLADELSGGRLVVSTEGGYSPIYNPFCLLGVLDGLAGESAGIADPWLDDATVVAARAAADDRVRAAIAAVRGAQPRWFT